MKVSAGGIAEARRVHQIKQQYTYRKIVYPLYHYSYSLYKTKNYSNMADIWLTPLHPYLMQDYKNVNFLRQQKELHFIQCNSAGIISKTQQGHSDR